MSLETYKIDFLFSLLLNRSALEVFAKKTTRFQEISKLPYPRINCLSNRHPPHWAWFWKIACHTLISVSLLNMDQPLCMLYSGWSAMCNCMDWMVRQQQHLCMVLIWFLFSTDHNNYHDDLSQQQLSKHCHFSLFNVIEDSYCLSRGSFLFHLRHQI